MEFDNLLKQACSIKSYQLNQDKKKFENYPEFIKSTLYCTDMVKNVRKQIFPLRKIAFDTLKSTGVKLLNKGAIDDALFRFEKALTIFKYINSKVSNWKNEAIKDEDLSYHEDKGENEEEKKEIQRMIITVLLNISLCYLKTNKFNDLKQVCDEIISRDNKNIKAYYRRAKSIMNCPSSSLEDHELALEDLGKCIELEDESNKKDIEQEYNKLKSYIESQKKDEKKVFKNFFRKTNEDLLKEEIKPIVKEESLPDGKAEIRMINLLVDQSINLMNKYEREGRTKDYWKMQEVVEQSKKFKENLERVLELNFDNPNEELYKFCKEHRLNLKDPNVKREFLKIRKEYLDQINRFYGENLFLNPNITDSIRNRPKKKIEEEPNEKEPTIKQEKKKKSSSKSSSKAEEKPRTETRTKSSRKKKSDSNMYYILIPIIAIIFGVGLIYSYYHLPPIRFKF